MAGRLSAGRVRATYEFIKAHRHEYRVQTMCCVLEVAASGYYDWLQQPISNRAQEDARLFRLIRASFIASQGIGEHDRADQDRAPRANAASLPGPERASRPSLWWRVAFTCSPAAAAVSGGLPW